MGLIGIYSDLLFSFGAYQIDANRFIQHELSREAVYFFTEGTIPPIFTISVLGIPIIMFLFTYWMVKFNTFKYIKVYEKALFVFVFGLMFLRITAGLTWYDLIFTKVVAILQPLSFMLIGAVACLVTLMVKEAKDEHKNINENYS